MVYSHRVVGGILMALRDHKLRESVIEKKVKAYAKMQGWVVRKFVSPGKRGVSDNIFMQFPSKVFFIEFKAPGKKPTKAQMEEHNEIRGCGINVYVVDNIGIGIRIIDMQTAEAERGRRR